MIYPKFYIGPMSKNIINSIIEFSNKKRTSIGLIPSRRQIDYNDGYVDKTENFSFYTKLNGKLIILQRDHAGPGQGQIDDDGYESLKKDCFNMDLIHIDPWKKYSNYLEGLEETIKMIKYCDSLNPHLRYEVGTEESIRRFEINELESLLLDLSYGLGQELFNKIIYLVIQSGTSLKENTQTGNYDKIRLVKMVELCKRHKLMSKEHNGDYIDPKIIKEKFDLGLDAINIAPEFGLIETKTYLTAIKKIEDSDQAMDILNEFYRICLESGRWKKWVDTSFDPDKNRIKLIEISGHYVFSNPEFIEKVKSHLLSEIDNKVKDNIKKKLKELHGLIM